MRRVRHEVAPYERTRHPEARLNNGLVARPDDTAMHDVSGPGHRR